MSASTQLADLIQRRIDETEATIAARRRTRFEAMLELDRVFTTDLDDLWVGVQEQARGKRVRCYTEVETSPEGNAKQVVLTLSAKPFLSRTSVTSALEITGRIEDGRIGVTLAVSGRGAKDWRRHHSEGEMTLDEVRRIAPVAFADWFAFFLRPAEA